jgi:hypothetical protein
VNAWKVILATLVIFVAGAFTGGLLVRHSSQAKPVANGQRVESHPAALQTTNATRGTKLPPPLMGPLRKDFVDRLQKELKMDAAQRERIEHIISDGQEVTRQIWLEIEPDIYHTIVETKDKIRAELAPEQKAKFEELLKGKLRPPPSVATNQVESATTNAPSTVR